MKRLCDMFPDLKCDNCPFEGLCDPEICPCYGSVNAAINNMEDLNLRTATLLARLKDI